jgi:cathepsin L
MKMEGGSTMRAARAHSFLQQTLPSEKIWDSLAMAHNVKDQQNCGSCWAIASASTLEAHIQIYTGKPRTVSAQQIVMCTPNPRHCGGDGGCKGATSELAMAYVLKHGVAEESAVPYRGVDGTCTTGSASKDMADLFVDDKSSKGGAALGMTGWETLPKNQYAPLVAALAQRGPVAVSVAADDWFDYDNGIFNGCGKNAVIDHAVVAIGYGETKGRKYWLIQNSWGSMWGEKGHIRLFRHDADSYCGINNDPQKGVACQGETAPVPVCGMCGILFDSVVPHFG